MSTSELLFLVFMNYFYGFVQLVGHLVLSANVQYIGHH